MQRYLSLLILMTVCLFTTGAGAACTSPAGAEGDQVYNQTHKTMQFCDGTNWYSMKGGAIDKLGSLSCGTNQIAKWNGSAWACAADAGLTAEADPTVPAAIKDGIAWSEVSGKPAGFADGVDNVGLTAETDPQVAAVTSGKWCRGTGSQVTCDQAVPSGLPTCNWSGSQTVNGACPDCGNGVRLTVACAGGKITNISYSNISCGCNGGA